MKYINEGAVREHFGFLPPATLGNPYINPRTGKPYHKGTWHWWWWYHGLSKNDKGIFGDLEF